MTPTFERADPGSSKNAQPMTSPAPTAKGIPPESLVQIGTMMAACMAPNNATPSRPVTAPAIRNAVSVLNGSSALIIVMAPWYDRPNDLGHNDGLVLRLYISEQASWQQPDLRHKTLVVPEQIFFIHDAILPVPDSAHY